MCGQWLIFHFRARFSSPHAYSSQQCHMSPNTSLIYYSSPLLLLIIVCTLSGGFYSATHMSYASSLLSIRSPSDIIQRIHTTYISLCKCTQNSVHIQMGGWSTFFYDFLALCVCYCSTLNALMCARHDSLISSPY